MNPFLIAGAVLLVLFVVAREVLFGFLLPALGIMEAERGRLDRAARLYERLLQKRFFLLRGSVHGDLRYRLAWIYMDRGEFETAAGLLEQNLRRKLAPDVEAANRQRLADCLEGMGDTERSTAERQRARELLSSGKVTPAVRMRRAEGLSRERKYAEALEEFEGALASEKRIGVLHIELLLKTALCAFNAGQPDRAVKWAEMAVSRADTSSDRLRAHQIAALTHSAARNLPEAVRHGEAALEMARSGENPEAVARALTSLASHHMRFGDLVQAASLAAEAATTSLKSRRNARMVESEVLRLWGRWDAARTALEQARSAPAFAAPAEERRSQATLMLAQAGLEAEAANVQSARDCLEKCREEFETDAKISVWWKAIGAWVYALDGNQKEAERLCGEATANTAAFANDQGTQEMTWAHLARAYLALGEFEEAVSASNRYLSLPLERPFRVSAQFHLGEALLGLGDTAGARTAFQSAVDEGLEVHFTQRARSRLKELGSPLPPGGVAEVNRPGTPTSS